MIHGRNKTLFIGLGVVALGLVIFSATLVHAVFYAPETEISLPERASTTRSVSEPIEHPARLLIPAISVDAHVQDVGIAFSGNMAPPSNFSDVGWYKYGTVPGRKGSAVMAGHVDNGLALPGVFKRLDELRTGDDIYVFSDTGRKLRFEVTSVDFYKYRDVPTMEVFLANDQPYLKLLSCTGSWVQSDRTYDHRLLVTAVLRE